MRLGPYELVKLIGQGGAGVVWRAVAPDGREVAVKVLTRGSSDHVARYDREARLHAALGHEEGFVPLLGVERTDRATALIMPLMAGSLRDRLERGPLSVTASLELARRLAAALARAHALGIVHRDMKPENVLFSETGQAYVADLGVAKHFASDTPGASQSVALSKTGDFKGTAGYMPPEQMQDSKSAAPAADVFAIGAVIYECLAGQPAFSGRSLVELLENVERGSFLRLGTARPDAPHWLVKTVERALSADPARRFADAGELARALDAAPLAQRSRVVAVAIALLVALAAAIALAIAASRPGGPPPEPARPPTAPAPPAPKERYPLATWDQASEPDPAAADVLAESVAASRGFRVARVLSQPHKRWATTRSFARSLGGTLAIGGDDGRVTVLNVGEGKRLNPFAGKSPVTAVAVTPELLVVGCESGALSAFTPGGVNRWHGTSGGPVLSLDRTEDGSRAIAVAGGAVEVWDVARGMRDARHAIEGKALAASLSGDEKRAVVATGTGVGELDLASGVYTELVSGEGPWRAASTPDGRRMLVARGDGRLFLRERASLREIADVSTSGISAVLIARDGRHGAFGTFDGSVGMLDFESDGIRLLRARPREVVALLYDNEEQKIAALKRDGAIEIVDTGEGGVHRGLLLDTPAVENLCVSSSGERLLASRADAVSAWDLKTGLCTGAWRPAVRPTAIALSPDGGTALVGDAQGSVLKFATSGDGAVPAPHVHEGPITGVAFFPDARRYVTAGLEGAVHIHDLDGRVQQTFTIEAGVTSIVLSREGQRLLVAARDGTTRLFHIASEKVLATYPAQPLAITFASLGRLDDRCVLATMAGDYFVDQDRIAAWRRPASRRSHWCGAVRSDFQRFLVGEEHALVEYDLTRPLDRLAEVSFGPTDTPSAIVYTEAGDRAFVGTDRGAIVELTIRE